METNTNTKSHSILSYITWIGWIVVLCIRDKEDEVVKHHLNQALVINLAATIVNIISRVGGVVGIICGILSLCIFVFWIIGLVRAAKLSTEPLPVLGGIQLIK